RPEECDAIRRYAGSGGSILATYETSLYNEWGDPRDDFALRDLFGASVAGARIGPQNNGYMRMERTHPVTQGFEGTQLLPAPEYHVPVRSAEEAPAPILTVVPRYPWYPPEMVYPRTSHTQEPAALFHDAKSRVAYFSGDIERTFW